MQRTRNAGNNASVRLHQTVVLIVMIPCVERARKDGASAAREGQLLTSRADASIPKRDHCTYTRTLRRDPLKVKMSEISEVQGTEQFSKLSTSAQLGEGGLVTYIDEGQGLRTDTETRGREKTQPKKAELSSPEQVPTPANIRERQARCVKERRPRPATLCLTTDKPRRRVHHNGVSQVAPGPGKNTKANECTGNMETLPPLQSPGWP